MDLGVQQGENGVPLQEVRASSRNNVPPEMLAQAAEGTSFSPSYQMVYWWLT